MEVSWLKPISLVVYVSIKLEDKLIISMVIIKLKIHPFGPLTLVQNNIYRKYENSEKNKFQLTKRAVVEID
jgi:hypothetical protein